MQENSEKDCFIFAFLPKQKKNTDLGRFFLEHMKCKGDVKCFYFRNFIYALQEISKINSACSKQRRNGFSKFRIALSKGISIISRVSRRDGLDQHPCRCTLDLPGHRPVFYSKYISI